MTVNPGDSSGLLAECGSIVSDVVGTVAVMATVTAPPLISLAAARRIALSAQGFAAPRSTRPAGTKALNSVTDRLALIQIDSVNAFERSHYLPAFARLGSYDKSSLDSILTSDRFTEYWAHEASFIPTTAIPLLRWRMQEYREWFGANENHWVHSNATMMTWLLAELREKGPLRASQIEHESNERRGPWWGWSDVKRGLEVLFRQGDVTTTGRTNFERHYALPEQAWSSEVIESEIPKSDAVRELVRISARALGIGTAKDIADYFRLRQREVTPALAELCDAGELVQVQVPGWPETWLDPSVRRPRSVNRDALLSPFDPIVWNRDRALRLFDFHYRIEIYTPAPKRVFGYYVVPVLLGEKIPARLDLKNDRLARVLRVRASWSEAALSDPSERRDAATRIAQLLRETASWQGLDSIEVSETGNFAREVATAVAEL